MPHSPAAKKKALTRVRRMRGQTDALERALEAGADCSAVLQQLAAIRGAVNGLMAEVLESYIREELSAAEQAAPAGRGRQSKTTLQDQRVHDITALVRTYLK